MLSAGVQSGTLRFALYALRFLEPLSDADRAAIDRALREPGITLSADELAALLAAGGDDEVRDLIVTGHIAEALGVARFNAFERQHPFAQRDQVACQRGA